MTVKTAEIIANVHLIAIFVLFVALMLSVAGVEIIIKVN